MSADVPLSIKFIDRLGNDTTNLRDGQPCVQIGFFFDRDVFDGSSIQVNCKRYWALIDTGADYNYVDADLLAFCGCPAVDGAFATKINSRDATAPYYGMIFIEHASLIIKSEFWSYALKQQGQPYSIILGRSFLQRVKMTWNGPENTCEAAFVPNE